MQKEFSLKRFFIGLLLLLPLFYIGLGWLIGLNYSRKSIIFGPYSDIPVVMKTSLLGSSLEEISGAKALVTVVPPGESNNNDSGSTHFKITGYFELPGTWFFDSSLGGKFNPKGGILLFGTHYQAIAHELKNPERKLGFYTVDELESFLKSTGRTKDLKKLKPYIILSKLEKKYPWAYSNTILLSPIMGNIFSDEQRPYDVLGLVGMVTLVVAFIIGSFRLWVYFLFWVFAYWIGRIGFHDPHLAFTNEGWKIILWSFWHGFILKEGRLFLVFLTGFSIIIFGILGFMYLVKHVIPRKKRELEDFFKLDKDAQKRKELSIETIEFKKVHYDINEKLKHYARTGKYFLAVSDDKKDITVEEDKLSHHLHVLGPTGSGKTSLVILPLAKQAIDKQRGCCFIDFKGDEVFKKYIQQKAKEKGKNFYYFSIDSKEHSIGYNPLFSGDIHSKVDRIMSALELIYRGPAQFYTYVQIRTFQQLLKNMTDEKREINFLSVRDELRDSSFLNEMDVSSQEVKGLLSAISGIAGIEAINRNELDLSKVIKNQDIIFFALKSQVNTSFAEAIGRMLIIDLKSQAVSRKETDPPYFIFIDEFQNLSCPHFIDVISKVRSANFCLILSNQSKGNLFTVSNAFENVVFTNTATKIIFMQEDPLDAKFWSDKTGQTTYQDKNILQIDPMNANKAGAKLDGLRSSQATIHTALKNYISKNVFLTLPFSKSVIFLRGKLAVLANHEFLFDAKERDRLISASFEYAPEQNQKLEGGS